MPHKNSQKRIYENNAISFVTSKTQNDHAFFHEDIFCKLWIEELKFCKKLKDFKLFAFCLLPNHFHILFQPKETKDLSDVVHFLKRHFSRNANIILNNQPRGAVGQPRFLEIDDFVQKLKKQFIQKHGDLHNFPKFSWQKSFHDHIIRDERDLENHFEYTSQNHLKHQIDKGWKYTSLNFSELIDGLE